MASNLFSLDQQRVLDQVRHSFLEGLNTDEPYQKMLFDLLVEEVPNAEASLQLKDLGSVGTWHEWNGQAVNEEFNQYSGLETMKEWHIEVAINKQDLKFGGGKLLQARSEQAGKNHFRFMVDRLIATHLDVDASASGAAARVLGGTKYFRATGDSGHFGQAANVNSLTYNSTSTSALTAAEWGAVHDATIAAIRGFKDDKGRFLHPSTPNMTYVAGPGHAKGFAEAFKVARLSDGSDNPYMVGNAQLGGAQLLIRADVTSSRVVGINTSPGTPKPFFLLRPIKEEDFVEIDVYENKQLRKQVATGHATWQLGFGNQLGAVLTTLS